MASLILAALTAASVSLAAPPQPEPRWVTLAEPVRVTYYGPRYVGGEVTASGVRYMPDDDIAALGPELLAAVRAHYAAEPYPAGGYPLLSCWGCEPAWWGYAVRVCDGDGCEELRVADTGSDALEVDLPDETWLRFGYPAERGVFTGTVEVLTWEADYGENDDAGP